MSTIPRSDVAQPSPSRFPSEVGSDVRSSARIGAKPRNWRVIHACEYARDVLPVVEGQVTAGMRPYIVTPQGAGTAELYLAKKDLEQRATLSLLRAWQDVRNWRKSILECDPENTSDIVHAHSFAAGMAAVRGFSCVVYDLTSCIEEMAIASGQCEPGSWMGRSFRVAEQFVLTRAEAVIVHSLGMKSAVEERGAPKEGVFLIPEPLSFEEEILLPKSDFLKPDSFYERLGVPAGATTYFVPQFLTDEGEALGTAALSVLEAFALLVGELPGSRLLVGATRARAALFASHLERLGIRDQVLLVEDDLVSAAMRNVDVLIAMEQVPADLTIARQPNEVCLDGLRLGVALLAADVPRNRDASPDGRGCLWFNSDDVRDLSHRMAFLGSNPDFRSALANSGRTCIFETRNSAAVGRKYDAAYRYAINRKKSGGRSNMASLQPAVSANW
jgi:glycosyltransferase involved in cell wall biosynthesis